MVVRRNRTLSVETDDNGVSVVVEAVFCEFFSSLVAVIEAGAKSSRRWLSRAPASSRGRS